MSKDEKRKQQIEELERATRSVLESDGFRAYMRTRKAFHNYSINNQLLIAIQQPTVDGEPTAEYATRVAGFKAWKKLDRHVVKGATGLKIFAPWTVIEKDDDGEPKRNADGEIMRRTFFKLVSVFDVSQTDGAPLPELPISEIESADHADLFERLLAFATDELELIVEGRDLSERPEGGWYDPQNERIVYDSSVAIDAQVRTLTHEIAHALGVGYAEFGRGGAEVIVEAATTVVLDAFGLDTSGASFPYIAVWGEKDGLEALRKHLAKIDEVATRIEEAVRVEAPELEAVAV